MLFFLNSANAQTYATPELKAEAEKLEQERNKNIKPTSVELIINEVPLLPDFNLKINKQMYVLSNVDAVDYLDKYTEEELLVFKKEAKGEFDSKNYILDWGNNKMYIVNRVDNKLIADINFKEINQTLIIQNCRDCADNNYKIKEHTENTITLELKPQDEGDDFLFVFSFKNKKL